MAAENGNGMMVMPLERIASSSHATERIPVVTGFSPEEVMRFVLLRQSGAMQLARVAPDGNSGMWRDTMSRKELLATVADPLIHPWNYVRLHPLKWRHGQSSRELSSRRDGVEQFGWNLWADLDDVTLREFEQALSRFDVPYPSLIWHTGGAKPGSMWALWKLSTPIAVEWIEFGNRALAALVGADQCGDATRLARIPMSFHHKTGAQGWVVSFSAERHAPDSFEEAMTAHDAQSSDEIQRPPNGPLPRDLPTAYVEKECDPARAIEAVDANGRNRHYLESRQTIRHSDGGEFDRSAECQSLLYTIVNAGYGDPEEIAYLAHRVFDCPWIADQLAARREARVTRSIGRAIALWSERASRKPRNSNPDCLHSHRQWRRAAEIIAETMCRPRLNPIALLMEGLQIQKSQAYWYRQQFEALTEGLTPKEGKTAILRALDSHRLFCAPQFVESQARRVRNEKEGRWSAGDDAALIEERHLGSAPAPPAASIFAGRLGGLGVVIALQGEEVVSKQDRKRIRHSGARVVDPLVEARAHAPP